MIGFTTQQSPNASTVKSVGQRLKDASCRGKEFGGTNAAMLNGSAANHATGKGAKQQNAAAERTLRMHHPIILNELQKNTVRVIGQVLLTLCIQLN